MHHALFTAALQNYHSASDIATNGDMHRQTQLSGSDSAAHIRQSEMSGNEWGFEHMVERVEAAQKEHGGGEEAEAAGVVVRLPDLKVCPLSMCPSTM